MMVLPVNAGGTIFLCIRADAARGGLSGQMCINLGQVYTDLGRV